MSVDHYENFPVASVLLPKRLRPAVQTIYAFARSADDIADEGDALSAERIEGLTAYETALDRIENKLVPESKLFADLEKIIEKYQLPLQPFRDLISAFKQDVVKTRYANFEELKDYCCRSADPVGTLMLYLYGAADEKNLRDSDAICTALQLINFWQDVAIDWQKDRIYLPQDSMKKFGVDEAHIDQQILDDRFKQLMAYEITRARALMLSGAPLAKRLPGRIGWELRLVVQGGLRILERLENVNYDMFHQRPKLGKKDWFVLAARAINA